MSKHLEQQFGFEVYPKRDLTIVRGEGVRLWDDEGREYIDCASGIGVASIGHANPVVARAIARQAETLVTCPGIFYNDVRGQLMEKLIDIAPDNLRRVFLCNSGTEAVEAAIKFARLTTGRHGIVSAMRGFHGRTLGALSATFKYRDEFEPLIPGHRFVPFNKLEKMAAAIDRDTAAVILEIIQGEGGVREADQDYLHGVRKLCDDNGALLIIDEVQTGFGRIGGRMFACQYFGIEPDMMTVAKAMGGGVPIGAVLCADSVAPAPGKHGSTFGGNPLACAAALATIEFIEEHNLVSDSGVYGDGFRCCIPGSLDAIYAIRGRGMMVGVELHCRVRPVLERLQERGVLALPAGPKVLRLLPPLVISPEELETVRMAIIKTLQEFATDDDL